MVVYPISRGRFINVVAFFSNIADEGKPLDGPEIKSATTEEVLSHFVGWEEEVQELLGVSGTECIVLETSLTRKIRALKTRLDG